LFLLLIFTLQFLERKSKSATSVLAGHTYGKNQANSFATGGPSLLICNQSVLASVSLVHTTKGTKAALYCYASHATLARTSLKGTPRTDSETLCSVITEALARLLPHIITQKHSPDTSNCHGSSWPGRKSLFLSVSNPIYFLHWEMDFFL